MKKKMKPPATGRWGMYVKHIMIVTQTRRQTVRHKQNELKFTQTEREREI
jgi:hypothetical protein